MGIKNKWICNNWKWNRILLRDFLNLHTINFLWLYNKTGHSKLRSSILLWEHNHIFHYLAPVHTKLMFNGTETATYASLVKGFSESIGRRSSYPKYGVGFESVRRSLKRNSLIPLASIFPSDAVLVSQKV